MTQQELIAKGDAICANSQETFKRVGERFPGGEEEPNVAYSRQLVGISARAVSRFDALTPPAGARSDYEAYVRAQERVRRWDREALEAAQRGDEAAYLGTREQRDLSQSERQQLAEAVGFKECSGSGK